MTILYQYASRSRPQRFFEGLANILTLQHDKDNFFIHCVLDEDDQTIDGNFLKQAATYAERYPGKILWNFGQSTGKINAINRKLPSVHWDILVNFSDDMEFTRVNFDLLIRQDFDVYGNDIFVHFPDQDAGAELPTMSIMGRKYFEHDGYIYHPSYVSLWSDNEARDVAIIRGKYKFDNTRIFHHLLPALGYLPRDPQFDYQQSFFEEDKRNYERRKAINFDL